MDKTRIQVFVGQGLTLETFCVDHSLLFDLHFDAFRFRHPFNIYKLDDRPEATEEKYVSLVVSFVFCSLDNMAVAFRSVNFGRWRFRRRSRTGRSRRSHRRIFEVFDYFFGCDRRRMPASRHERVFRNSRTCVSSISSFVALPTMEGQIYSTFLRRFRQMTAVKIMIFVYCYVIPQITYTRCEN